MAYRKTYEVVGYTYEADHHCVDCTVARFGTDLDIVEDSEGNSIHPMFLGDLIESTTCGTCGVEIE